MTAVILGPSPGAELSQTRPPTAELAARRWFRAGGRSHLLCGRVTGSPSGIPDAGVSVFWPPTALGIAVIAHSSLAVGGESPELSVLFWASSRWTRSSSDFRCGWLSLSCS